jgi:hypothetical protein
MGLHKVVSGMFARLAASATNLASQAMPVTTPTHATATAADNTTSPLTATPSFAGVFGSPPADSTAPRCSKTTLPLSTTAMDSPRAAGSVGGSSPDAPATPTCPPVSLPWQLRGPTDWSRSPHARVGGATRSGDVQRGSATQQRRGTAAVVPALLAAVAVGGLALLFRSAGGSRVSRLDRRRQRQRAQDVQDEAS